MKKRFKMSKRGNRSNFQNGATKSNRKNGMKSYNMRGGIRL